MSEEKTTVSPNDVTLADSSTLKDAFGASRPTWAPTAEQFASTYCKTPESFVAFCALLREACGSSAPAPRAAEPVAPTDLPPWACVMRGVTAVTPRVRVDLYFCADSLVLDAKGKYTMLPYAALTQVAVVPSANGLETMIALVLAPGQPALSGKTKVPVVVLKFPASATLAQSPVEPSPDCSAVLDLNASSVDASPAAAGKSADSLQAAAASYRAPLSSLAAAAGGLASVPAADVVAALVCSRSAGSGVPARLPTGSPGPLPCYYKAADGHLYVLRAGALFLGRPPLFVPVGRVGDLVTKQAGPSNVDLVITVDSVAGASSTGAGPMGVDGGRLEFQMLPKSEAGVLTELSRYVTQHRQRAEKTSEKRSAAGESAAADAVGASGADEVDAQAKRPRAAPEGDKDGSSGNRRRSTRAASVAASSAPMIDSEDDGDDDDDDDAYGEDDAAADDSDAAGSDDGDEGDEGDDSDSGSGSGSDSGYVSDTDEELSSDDEKDDAEVLTSKRRTKTAPAPAPSAPAPAAPAVAAAVSATTEPAPAQRPGAPLIRPGAPLSRPGAPLTRPGAPLSRPGAPISHPEAAISVPAAVLAAEAAPSAAAAAVADPLAPAVAELPAAVVQPPAPSSDAGAAGSVDAFRAFMQSKQRKDA